VDYLKKPQVRSSEPVENLPAAADPSSQDPAILREVRERTQLAFDQLPAKLRVVATLALIEECPHGEIAEALDISTAAVKSRLFRATLLLRRKLGNLDTTHE
jgi:RNA polymerase sigma factor (sigma-70 family)